MKNNLRKLNLLFRFTKLKPEMFYVVGFSESEITLQGYFKPEVAVICRKLFKTQGFTSDAGYVKFSHWNIEVTLT